MAIALADVEITGPLPTIGGLERYNSIWVLARYKGRPLGYVRIANCPRVLTAKRLAVETSRQLGYELLMRDLNESITEKVPTEAESSQSHKPLISVVVCTKDRTELLRHTLDSLLAQRYENFEALVVDNTPSSNETERLLAEYPFRYVMEPHAGHSWARNRGIRESSGEIVAFIDDDMTADSNWLETVAEGFADPEIMCMTGLVLPSELETDAQVLFQSKCGGFGADFEPRVFAPGTDGEPGEYWIGQGMGSHMAFRREIFLKLGTFDVALGLPVGGAEDEDILHRIVRNEYAVAYCPQALRFHKHRERHEGLRRQMFDYSRSTFALLAKCFVREKDNRLRVIKYCAFQFWYDLVTRLVDRDSEPFGLLTAQALGALCGPWAYIRSVMQVRRLKLSREWYALSHIGENKAQMRVESI